jgi:hypothetical protein
MAKGAKELPEELGRGGLTRRRFLSLAALYAS